MGEVARVARRLIVQLRTPPIELLETNHAIPADAPRVYASVPRLDMPCSWRRRTAHLNVQMYEPAAALDRLAHDAHQVVITRL